MAAPALLEVEGLVKEYPGVTALGGVDLDVRAGEVHCLVGPNGAGKSTLIKCISGAVAPTSGEIRIDGEKVSAGDPSAAMARGVATIYQELDLVEDLSVAQNIFLGHEPTRWGFLDRARMRRETNVFGEIVVWSARRRRSFVSRRMRARSRKPQRVGSCPRKMFCATLRSSTRSSSW